MSGEYLLCLNRTSANLIPGIWDLDAGPNGSVQWDVHLRSRVGSSAESGGRKRSEDYEGHFNEW